MVDGEAEARQTHDGALSFKLRHSSGRQFQADQPLSEPYAWTTSQPTAEAEAEYAQAILRIQKCTFSCLYSSKNQFDARTSNTRRSI
jgi:hypothetical protein